MSTRDPKKAVSIVSVEPGESMQWARKWSFILIVDHFENLQIAKLTLFEYIVLL